MIVAADTSPLNYLVQIDEIELLPELFGRVLISLVVLRELNHTKTSEKVRDWVSHLPSWIEVKPVSRVVNKALLELDPGEGDAIQLALDYGIGTVLIDEADGRRQAEALLLEVRGTLGIIERGPRLGKTDFRRALGRLEQRIFLYRRQ